MNKEFEASGNSQDAVQLGCQIGINIMPTVMGLCDYPATVVRLSGS